MSGDTTGDGSTRRAAVPAIPTATTRTPDGTIGAYGLDVATATLKPPT